MCVCWGGGGEGLTRAGAMKLRQSAPKRTTLCRRRHPAASPRSEASPPLPVARIRVPSFLRLTGANISVHGQVTCARRMGGRR